MTDYRLTEAGRIGLRMLLDAETLCRADRNGLHLLGMEDVVDLPDEWTEPVPPPLPPEPPIGRYSLRAPSGTELLAQRVDWRTGWSVAGLGWREWEWIVDTFGAVTATRLVPAPEPVTLPWEHGRQRITVGADGAGRGIVSEWINNDIAHSSPDDARAKAYALLSAAEQAERGAAS